jgi:hypothetical protein
MIQHRTQYNLEDSQPKRETRWHPDYQKQFAGLQIDSGM